jgi:hypothetical protein
MQFLNKYKIFTNTFIFLQTFPRNKLLSFKRPKWLKIKSFLKKLNFKKYRRLYNNVLIKSRYKRIEKMYFSYKESLILKRSILNFFNNSFSLTFLKKLIVKQKLTHNYFSSIFFKPLYKIDILLWKLHFFNSVYEVRQAIYKKLIFINHHLKKSFWLLKGDIICIKGLKKIHLFSPINFLNFLVEIDYYTNTIIILKDLDELTIADLALFIKEYVPLKKFLNYIRL